MSETAQETTAVTATLVEHKSEMLPAVTDKKKKKKELHIYIDPTSIHAELDSSCRIKAKVNAGLLVWNHIGMYFTVTVFV